MLNDQYFKSGKFGIMIFKLPVTIRLFNKNLSLKNEKKR